MEINQKYKNAALAALDGNWAAAVVATIVLYAILYVVIGPYYATILPWRSVPVTPNVMYGCMGVTYAGLFLLIMPLTVGISYAFYQLYAYGDGNITSNMLSNSLNGYLRNVWAMFLYVVYVFLWTLLLFIPGIIKSFSYAMTPYILKDYPELSANQAIDLSRKMMKGHKLDLFILHLSFIGWYILSIFTAGIGMLWLVPYVSAAQAAFYQDIKNDYVIKY